MRRLLAAAFGATVLLAAAGPAPAQDKPTIALIPGLTTDAFYITMRKGAEAAAKAVGAELVFQGAPDFNPVTQVPVLDAVVAGARLGHSEAMAQMIEQLRVLAPNVQVETTFRSDIGPQGLLEELP